MHMNFKWYGLPLLCFALNLCAGTPLHLGHLSASLDESSRFEFSSRGQDWSPSLLRSREDQADTRVRFKLLPHQQLWQDMREAQFDFEQVLERTKLTRLPLEGEIRISF